MRALVLTSPGPLAEGRLELRELPVPEPGPGQVLIEVRANGVCRTDLHVIEGELPSPKLPLVLGHQIVGTVAALGEGVSRPARGERVGVPWLGGTDGTCAYCRAGEENLCDAPTFTGYQVDGGYAEHAVARADFVLSLPDDYPDLQAAPLLCAGPIGYRALRLAEPRSLEEPLVPGKLGLYGIRRVSPHRGPGRAPHGPRGLRLHAGEAGRELALELGAAWSGGSDEDAPAPMDSAIIFAPAGSLVPRALAAVRKGGWWSVPGSTCRRSPSFRMSACGASARCAASRT